MHGFLPGNGKLVTDKSISNTDTSASDDENWFSEMAKALFAKPGLELHLLSDLDERSCHRYAAGSVKPPAYFLRELLRSERGGAVLAFLMQDSHADWWLELQAARELCAKFKVEPR